jgi:hypothetical protein
MLSVQKLTDLAGSVRDFGLLIRKIIQEETQELRIVKAGAITSNMVKFHPGHGLRMKKTLPYLAEMTC